MKHINTLTLRTIRNYMKCCGYAVELKKGSNPTLGMAKVLSVDSVRNSNGLIALWSVEVRESHNTASEVIHFSYF